MWSEDYRARDELLCEVLNALCAADKMNLVKPLCERMDDWANDKVERFNKLCRNLICRYGGQS